MNLRDSWQKYQTIENFNYSDIAEYIREQGQRMVFKSGKAIVEKSEFPSYIYFIIEGIAIGQRRYEDGNEYSYFQVDKKSGNIGLLEVLSKKEQYVATITCLTNVTVVKVESAIIYELIMNNIGLLRKCSFLLARDLYSRSGNDGIYYYYTGIDRVRLYLINYFDQQKNILNSSSLQIGMNYEEIANQIGVSVRTIGRSIKQLKETKEVKVSSKKISISVQQYEKMKSMLQK
ncbi:Crp/Fnr family transcriptional regulator [Carnobacterium sp.]|uniref:Crp/Fnr family transcriptional regulator n=1 Tax=Carnobacterium sp. TaxID=48221 RepID=UPI0028ADC3EC|nr:Crp/Fnr family transcriptional regulator [Carnobacterium sp.]